MGSDLLLKKVQIVNGAKKVYDGVPGYPLQDASGALANISFTHHKVHAGDTFMSAFRVEDLADDGSAVVAISCGSRIAHMVGTVLTTGDTYFDIAAFPVLSSAGSAQYIARKNGNTTTLPTTGVYLTPGVSSAGVTIFESVIPGGQKTFASGGTGGHGGEWVLVPNNNYLLTVTNKSGSATTIGFQIEWYEGSSL